MLRRVCIMNIGNSSSEKAVDESNESIHELYNDDFRDPGLNFGKDELMTINSNQACQSNIFTINSGSTSGGGSTNKCQREIPQEMMSVSIFTTNSSTSTLQRSGHILSSVPKSVSNHASLSSQTCKTMDLPQFAHQSQPLKQQVFRHKTAQQPPTHPSMAQPTIMFSHQMNNQQTPSHHLHPYPRPVSIIHTSHLQNQPPLRQQSNIYQWQQRQYQPPQPMQNFQRNKNQTQLQFQKPIGGSHILIREGGQNKVQGPVIGEGKRNPQEHRQGNISAVLSAPVGFATPNQFSSNEIWREYAFRQVAQMKERYLSELLKIHKRAVHLCTKETNTVKVKRYDNAKEFLEMMIMFLNIPRVDLIPKNNERVYKYMNFIVKYLTSFMNKNGGSSQKQPVHQATNS